MGRSASLSRLDLGANKIGAEGARGLGAALVASSTLTSLSLWSCGIGGAVCRLLSKGVGRSASLTTMNLDGNEIGDDGARGLGEALLASTP